MMMAFLKSTVLPESVGELAVFKHLQQDVEEIRMRLLDFVEQDDRVGRALHALGQLAALFVADVSRRRTDQLRDRVLLHELRHIEADQRLLAAEHELRQGARDFGLADAGRAEEEERADRAVRTLQAGTRAANGAGQRRDGAVLRDDALVQLFFDAQQLRRSSSLIEAMGTPVQRETTSSMSSRPTTPVDDSSR